LATAGVLTGCRKSDPNAINRFIAGKVLVDGKGLPDVVISDGFSVVKTAEDGSYQLDLTGRSTNVFVSVPSGFEFPHENFICRHYKRLTNTPLTRHDFHLKRVASDDTQHKFVIWADPQIRTELDVQRFLTTTVPDMEKFAESMPSGTLVHGICVGDIVGDNLPLFNTYNDAIARSSIPFYQVIGNHDLDYDNGGGEGANESFSKMYGPTYYSFNRGKVHYVVLNNVFYLGSGREYKGYVSEDQLNWLRKDLSYVSPNKLIVLCTHIPVTYGIENKRELYEILKPFKVHVMSGHMHINQNFIEDNVYEHVHGAVCGAWWSGSVCTDGTPLGYAVYDVNETELNWYYKSVGFEKEYQVRATVKNSNGRKILNVNVWNWDPTWKVECWADGSYSGAMNRVNYFDAMAVAQYAGDQLPYGQPLIEPTKTDHLFSSVLPSATKNVRVLATDPSNREYEVVLKL
jgi:hypothetical protein